MTPGIDFPGGIDIALKGLLSIVGGSSIVSMNEFGSMAKAKSGPISIRAREVQLGDASGESSGSIASAATSSRAADDVTIEANSIAINGAGIIANIADDDGAAGKTSLRAGTIVLNGPGGSFNDGQVQGSIVNSGSATLGQTGGDVEIRASSLQINGGSIANRTSGSGNGGNIVISAGNVNLTGGTITDSSSGGGNAGNIRISADSLTLTGRSTPQQEGPVAGIGASTSGAQGANINIHTGSLTVDGAFIAANRVVQDSGGIGNVPPGPSVGADAANITINASKVIKLVNANIFADNPDAGGNVNFTAERSIMVQDSTIDASGGAGGGNVFFKAPMVAILDSNLNAAAPSPPDGRVGIEACLLEFDGNAVDAAAGLQADIMICETPPGNWPERPPRGGGWPEPVLPNSPGLPPPPSIPDLIKQTPLASECGVKFDISSFIVRGRGGVALEPGGWQPGLNVPQVSPAKK